MKKLTLRWSNICSKPINFRITLLCKIFVIGLLLQFFLQTFVTFKLGRNGKFWTLIWMWKEFILLIFLVILIWYFLENLKKWTNAIKNKEHVEKITRALLLKNIKSKFILQFILIFTATIIIFFLLAIGIQHVGIKAFVLSAKYDLMGFFIFGIGACLALLFFNEKDKNILELYNKIIIRSLRIGLIRRIILWLMPNVMKIFGFDPLSYEGTVGQKPPTAYYTKIYPYAIGSHVRNSYLFERPTSFGFWLIAFFPVFVLGYLRKKKRKDQLFPIISFGLLIFSTWSRAGIVVRVLEVIILFFFLFRKSIKKYFISLLILSIIGLLGIAYLSRGIMIREHSNTGHLVLMKAGRNIAKENLILGRGAGYSGPASHQLCYTDETIDIFTDINSIHLNNNRCELIRKTNIENQISTYGFNPENQYLQILMEYGIVGLIFWLALCIVILRYTAKMIRIYREKNKSTYQELLYYTLLGFGIGFVGLCTEGLLLHSLVDRMIIYPFFLLYGITIGLRENIKDKPYIPPEPKKKKKSKKIVGKTKK